MITRLRRQPELVLVPLLFVLIVGSWETYVKVNRVPAYEFPAPSAVAMALYRGLSSGLYIQHFWYTLAEALGGFVLGGVSAIICGTFIAQFRIVDKTLYPYLVVLQTMPRIALAPLLILWLGFGIWSKIIIAALVSFFPVLVNVIAGLKSVDQDKLDLMGTLTATRWQTFLLVTFPNALPYIFAGLHVAVIFSVLGAVVGEFVGAQKGLGNLLIQLNYNMDLAGTFSVILLLSAMGLSLHLAMRWLEARLIYWTRTEEMRGL